MRNYRRQNFNRRQADWWSLGRVHVSSTDTTEIYCAWKLCATLFPVSAWLDQHEFSGSYGNNNEMIFNFMLETNVMIEIIKEWFCTQQFEMA